MMSSPEESNNFDDEYDETETMQLPIHDQLPSLEEVHQKSSLDLPSGTFEETHTRRRIRRRGLWIVIAVPFFLVVAVIVGTDMFYSAAHPAEEMGVGTTVGGPGAASTTPVSTTTVSTTEEVLGVGTTVGGPGAASATTVSTTDTPTVPPTATSTAPPTGYVKTRMELAVEYLGRVFSDVALFEEEESPQAHALEWIVNGDVGTGRLEVPTVGRIDPPQPEHRFLQRYALAVLYYALADVLSYGNTDNWKREFYFLSSLNECEWNDRLEFIEAERVYYYGVACDDQGRVTSIVMPKNRLEGILPPEIALLPQLRVLNLSENRIYGELPPTMSILVHLEEALFAMNDISGTIPDYLNTFTHLKKLSFLDNMFTGTLPDLPNLRKLTHLDLSNNKDLAGTIPASWGDMQSLRGLFLSFNGLWGSIPQRIGDLTNLRDLRLSGNDFSGTIPDSLDRCFHLKNLYLDENELTGELYVLGSLPFLEGVFLEDNNFEGDIDTFVEYFDDIMILDASNNQLRGTLPLAFFQKDRLQVLDLSGNQLAGNLPNFPENGSLEYLALQNNAFGNDLPASVSHLRALTHLDVSHNNLTGSLPASLGNMDRLTYLSVGRNSFGPAPLPRFLQRLTALRELSLRDTGLTGTIPSWMQVLQELVLLDLGENALEGTVPARAFLEMQNLTFVQLSGNALEGVLPKVFGELPKLRMFMVGGNSFTALETGFCEGGGNLVGALDFRSYFSGDCDKIPATLSCFNECCEGGECPKMTELLTGQDLQWGHTYGYWFSSNERIVYDIRPMIAAGELGNKDSYAQYNIQEFDYGIDDEDDGYFDDVEEDDIEDDIDDFFDDDIFDDNIMDGVDEVGYARDDVDDDIDGDDVGDDDFFDDNIDGDDVGDDDFFDDKIEMEIYDIDDNNDNFPEYSGGF